jgi:hypothetical protein
MATETLTLAQLEAEAKLLYDECPTPKPDWEQLGEVTKDVWRERVLAGARAVLW